MRLLNASFLHGGQIAVAALLLTCAGFAYAQSSDDPGNDASDPPARVAQLSFASGDLGLMPSGSTHWSAADVNRPITNGDKLSSGPDAKAELDLGGAALRVDGGSDIGILNLNGQTGQFELTQGTVNIAVRTIDQGSTYEIDTPTLALVIEQPGNFRVDVPSDGSSTTVVANDGLATVYGQNNVQRQVYGGRRYLFSDSSLNDVQVSDISGNDAFDAWCSNRDSQEASDAEDQYVSNDMVGADNLDGWGNWEDNQDYGAIWYPVNVAVGWAPYRFGHWVWIAPWGWTWVDNSPWGFAPYHYGRWAFIHHRWGWLPGPRHLHPVYAPALVTFVGNGAGHPVGWFPLGPREVYHPWYRASRNYYTGVNLANIGAGRYYDQAALTATIHNQYGLYQSGRMPTGASYAYRNMPGAVTAVSAETFVGARNVQNSQVHLDAQQMAAAPVMAPTALQRPTTSSFAQPRLIDGRPLPSAGFNRPVVAVGRPSAGLAATASLPAGQPASNVRVLDVHPNAPAITRAQSAGGAEVIQQPRFVPPAQPPQPMGASAPRPAMLPQVPRFEPAQQVQTVRTVEPPQQRYQPAPQSYAPRQENPEQMRFESAQRSHEYVPERPPQMSPAYPSYERPNVMRPEQMQRPVQEAHPQNAPRPHESAPPPRRDSNQH